MTFKKCFTFLVLLAASSLSLTTGSRAQSVTAGDIQGVVTDTTGAAIPNAQVTVKNVANGATKTAVSSGNGVYRVALLSPGTYTVSASASGFSASSGTVTVAAGDVTTDDVHLSIGQANTTVEVSSAPEIVNTENADVVTAFTTEQVQAMPNPGNDLTFVAQTAPGSVMNTGTASGGYGNFSSFGISGLSNMFTLDGGYENDPFLNLNNTGAGNLTLGNNEVDTVTVVSPAYSAQFGGLGGAQVNEITMGGGNRVHGNANYYWSGRVLNSNDWFNKQNQAFNHEQNIPSFVNANQWAASIGGPILKDKLFFFVNTEGMRVTTPVSGQVYAPSPMYENCSLTGTDCAALNAAAAANCSTNPDSTCTGAGQYGPFKQAAASQVPLLTTMFNTFNNSPFRNPASVNPDPNDVSAVSYYAKSAAQLTEWLLMARVDYHISDKDSIFVHFKEDHGVQPTYTDLISPLFSDNSPQPSYESQLSETHTFTPNLVNQLVLTGNYYSAIFQNTNNYRSVSPFSFATINGDFANSAPDGIFYGGIDYAFPQGRRVSGYQVIDDVSYTKGRNTLHFGYNIRRDNISDLTQETTGSAATLAEGSVEALGQGEVGYSYQQNFPVALEQRVGVYNMGLYVEDSYKLLPNLTLTAGMRFERDSNPTCQSDCLQSLAFPVADLPTGTASENAPYNGAYPGGLISSGRYRAFKGYQKLSAMPRVSFAYQPFGTTGKTVVRGGFGMFTDTFPGSIADTLLNNAPTNFGVTVYGSDNGTSYAPVYLDPTTAGSAGAVAVASNKSFQSLYASGGSYNSMVLANSTYAAPNFATTAPHIYYPTYEEYSLAIEQRLDTKSSVSITYVGNHGYHEPVGNSGSNISSTGSQAQAAIPATPSSPAVPAVPATPGFFPNVPTASPVTAFATISNYYSGASSNYNGVVLSATRRSSTLTLQFNYSYSKALDEVSNGGLEPYSSGTLLTEGVVNPFNLHSNYGLSDYNVKQNTTASFVYNIPAYHRYKAIAGGFELSGVFFHQTGMPYSVAENTSNIGVVNPAGVQVTTSAFQNAGTSQSSVFLLANELNQNFNHHCGGGEHALQPDGSAPNPCDFKGSFGQPTTFTQQGRNSLIGPAYTDVDLGLFKVIAIPHYEFIKLKLGAQSFNLFNHPNFAAPGHELSGSGSSTLGAITSTVSSPTNIFGSVGANSSPRLIQLKATLTF